MIQNKLFTPHNPQGLLKLRPYQAEAVSAIYQHLRNREDNPLVVLPTGSGKTPVIATVCRDVVGKWKKRVAVLQPSKELIEQTADKLSIIAPEIDFGLFSASLNRKERRQQVIVASIQSIYDKACDFEPFDLIIPDEAHGIPPDGEGRYRQFLTDCKRINPHVRVVGLTATPYRMTTGLICEPGGIFNSICYEIGVRELISQGYLSPLISRPSTHQADLSEVHIRGGEYIASEAEAAMDREVIVEAACSEIVADTRDRRAVLVFAAGIDHGLHICNILESKYGQSTGFVSGDMPGGARSRLIQSFIEGSLKYLVNVNVLTTGFDAPHIDCVALLRPTMSPGLYYQMVGRGFRLAEGKIDCLIKDFAGNIDRHGPVDLLTSEGRKRGSGDSGAPTKQCPECNAVILCGYARCPHCSYQFPPPEKLTHGTTASDGQILSEDEKLAVKNTFFSVWHKKGDLDATPTMRVDYEVGPSEFKSEWICIEHKGKALKRAREWWRARSPDTFPLSVESAVNAAKCGALAETLEITVRATKGQKYDRVVDYVLGDKPEPLGVADAGELVTVGVREIPEEDIPF